MNSRIWAQRLVDNLKPDLRKRLASDPKAAIESALDIRVTQSPAIGDNRGDGGWCDGLSFHANREILYVPTPHSKRENFTLLHELGHILVDEETDDDILVWSADQPASAIEETCNLVAARILLPPDDIRETLNGNPPTGRIVAEMAILSSASREACAIAFSNALGCEGFVALVYDDRVTFASRSGDTRPVPWRGDPVPTVHQLRGVGVSSERHVESFWPNIQGTRRRYYLSAFREDRWTYAVFAEHDLWNIASLHIPEPSKPTGTSRYGRDISCRCGYRGWAPGFPHDTCHRMTCPTCNRCACDWTEATTERGRCKHCTLVVRKNLLVGGLCDNCR